jgi:hypothetical protein
MRTLERKVELRNADDYGGVRSGPADRKRESPEAADRLPAIEALASTLLFA